MEPERPHTITEIVEAIAPIVKAHGRSVSAMGRFIFYLLSVASAMAEAIGMTREEFLQLAERSFSNKTNNKLN